MVVRQILVLFVEVRILVGQQETRNASCGFCFIRYRSEIAHWPATYWLLPGNKIYSEKIYTI